MNKIYNDNNIEFRDRHSVIISIESGTYKYALNKDVSANNVLIKKGGLLATPCLGHNISDAYIPIDKNNQHITTFIQDLILNFSEKKGGSPDIISYLGMK